MGAVDIGVGHDDDAVVAQILVAVFRAGAAAQRLDQVGDLLVGRQLVAAGAGDVEDLAAQRQHGLHGAVARLLGRAAGRIALDDEDFRARCRVLRAVGQLAGKAKLAHGGLAADFLFLAAADALVGARDHPFEQLGGFLRIVGQPMVERIADGALDDADGLDGRQLVLGLADEFRLANEDRQHASRRDHHVFAGDDRGALVADQLGIGLRPRVSTLRKPVSWVPPSGVGMVLQ